MTLYFLWNTVCTQIKKLKSKIPAMPSGVPMGLVLGPILYYNGKDIGSFADDTALISSNSSAHLALPDLG